MEAFQAAWARWAGGSGAPRAVPPTPPLPPAGPRPHTVAHAVPFSSAQAAAGPRFFAREAAVKSRKTKRLKIAVREQSRELQLQTKLTPSEFEKVHIFPPHTHKVNAPESRSCVNTAVKQPHLLRKQQPG